MKLRLWESRRIRRKSPPAREVWIEIDEYRFAEDQVALSPPAREVWIEIIALLMLPLAVDVASREGGVD